MPVSATTNKPVTEPGWAIHAPPLRALLAIILVICATRAVFDIAWVFWLGPDKHLDFFGIWSFARFLRSGGGSGIYAPARLQAFQGSLAPGFTGFYPCPYPPNFLAATIWLAAFPIGIAKAIWGLLGLAMMLGATAMFFWRQWRPAGVVTVLLAPATLMDVTTGETGLFTGAFLLAGFAWLPNQPILAGIAFGLLSLKPQLALLVPFALLARQSWRAMAAAAITCVALAAASCLVFPPGAWLAWARSLPQYQRMVLLNQPRLDHFMTTAEAALLCLHMPPDIAEAVQAAAGAIFIALIWKVFRGADYRLAVGVLLAANTLAPPHELIYDTPSLTVALLVALESMAGKRMRLSTPMLLLFAAIYLLPFGLAGTASPYIIYSVPELFLVFALARQSRA